ncbi:MAG: aldo/keto reductase [Nitrospinota bacterium]|nr:aldo/keto reductase [Nitrospinota bacterium]
MRHVQCKGIDKRWSAITLGCWQIAPSEGWGDTCSAKDADAVVKTALEHGITAFDTAEGYGDGQSERRLGKALGPKKYEVIVISKIWPDAKLTLPSYQKQLEGTLRALDREYVDVYLIHWPGSYFNTEDKSRKLCDFMSALKEGGKTKTVGLSNFFAQNISLLGKGVKNFVINQVPYNLLEREYEGKTRELCQKEGISYMAYSPAAQGLLAGRVDRQALSFPARKYNRLYQEPVFHRSLKVFEIVKSIADEMKVSPISVALAWVMRQENILTAIVGSRKPKQVAEFAVAGNLQLNDDQLVRLTKTSDSFLNTNQK